MKILTTIITGVVVMMVVCFIGTVALAVLAIKEMRADMKELDDLASGKHDSED